MVNPLDPNGLIAPLQQSSGAQLAGYNTAIQNAIAKSVLGASRPADMQAALSYPSAPSLQFSPNPTFAQGVGEGIGNFMALRNYRTRTEMLNQSVLEAKQKEQRQLDMLKAAEEAKQHNETLQMNVIREKYPDLADAYAYGSREQRDAIWGKIGDNSGASYDGQASKVKTRLTKEGETDAEFSEMKRRMDLLKGVDINTPEGQNTFRAIMNFDPKTQTDIQQSQANLESTQLGNAGKETENRLKSLQLIRDYITTRYAEDNAIQDLRAKTLSGDLKSDELSRLQRLPQVVDAAMQRLQSGEGLTGTEMFELQTTINVLANKDPKFLDTFKDFGFVKKDKVGNYALDQKSFDTFFKDGPRPKGAFGSFSIQPSAQQGHLVQDPSTGKWYDTNKRDSQGIPMEVPAPGQGKPAPAKPTGGGLTKKPDAAKPQYRQELIDVGKSKQSVKVPIEGSRERAAKDPYLNAIIPKSGQVPGLTASETQEYAHLLTKYRKEHSPTQYNMTIGDYSANPVDAFFNHLGTGEMDRLKFLHSKHMGKR